MRPRQGSIAGRLVVLSIAVLLVALGLTSIVATLAAQRHERELIARWLGDKVQSVADSVDAFDRTSRVMAERAYKGFRQSLPGPFSLDPVTGTLRHANLALNGRFDEVDAFARNTGGVATVFVRKGDDFERITTNVRQANGERAVGTKLARTSPAFAAVSAGKTYMGRAVLFGTPYMAVYEPVRDAAGTVVGVLFIGFDISEFQRSLGEFVANTRFFETGGVYIIDPGATNADATFVSHPSANGKKVLEVQPSADAFLTMLREAGAGSGLLEEAAALRTASTAQPWAIKRTAQAGGWWVVAEVPQAEAMARHWSDMQVLWGLLAGCAATLALALFLLVRREVGRPLAEMTQAVTTLAQGDLSRPFTSNRHDEVGRLVAEVETMRQRFAQLMGQLRAASDSIHTASAQIAAGNQDLSARTEQAASNLQETAASMEQLATTVRQSAASAGQADQLATAAAAAAGRGGAAVSKVVTTMNEIHQSSRRIGDIIGVIDGIAFQTNILALNAAVEAARAGEQGRGFAVVASEVRGLAQRSADAAKEIKTLISDSIGRVESGSRQVADAGATVEEVVGSVQRVAGIIGEITTATRQQSAGLDEINTAITQLDEATQQNAALVEESTAAAQSMSAQAASLADAIRIFRTAAA